MEARFVILFCVLAAASAAKTPTKPPKIKLYSDRPSLRLAISDKATIQCCWVCNDTVEWLNEWLQNVMITTENRKQVFMNTTNERMKISREKKNEMQCSNLVLKDINLNDTGLYQCVLTQSNTSVVTPGTYLQVYVPVQMILDISERSKNSIITAQGVLLLLLALLPGTMLICKSKGLNELEKRKSREEENIYEGLNLDDCNSTYHQIQRSLVHGPYQDVMNSDGEDVQLEKP